MVAGSLATLPPAGVWKAENETSELGDLAKESSSQIVKEEIRHLLNFRALSHLSRSTRQSRIYLSGICGMTFV